MVGCLSPDIVTNQVVKQLYNVTFDDMLSGMCLEINLKGFFTRQGV